MFNLIDRQEKAKRVYKFMPEMKDNIACTQGRFSTQTVDSTKLSKITA